MKSSFLGKGSRKNSKIFTFGGWFSGGYGGCVGGGGRGIMCGQSKDAYSVLSSWSHALGCAERWQVKRGTPLTNCSEYELRAMSKLAEAVVLFMLPLTRAKAQTEALDVNVMVPVYSHLRD